MDYRTLIQAAELDALLNARPRRTIVFDCSFELTNPGAGHQQYLEAHVPWAQYLDLERDLSGPPNGHNGRHPLPYPAAFAIAMAAQGVCASTQVVCYDNSANACAARAWWMLRWIGHEKVAVLDGGLAAWTAAGLPLEKGARTTPLCGDIQLKPSLVKTVDRQALLANLDGGPLLVLDARSHERFIGESDPFEQIRGHIPGARNRVFRDNLDASGRFKPGSQLKAEFDALTDGRAPDQLVTSCGSGVTACHNLLALEIAGLSGAALYPGSWSEWSNSGAPVATGPA